MAVPIRVYAPGEKTRTQPVWLAQVRIAGAVEEPWVLLTDWPVATEAEAPRILRAYCRRWSVEDTFKFVKTCCGAEEVQCRIWKPSGGWRPMPGSRPAFSFTSA